MALATSVLGGPLMRAALRRPQRWSVTDLIVPKTFVRRLAGTTRDEALKELVAVACAASGLEESATETAVRKREAAGPTGIENGLAIAHACMPGLSSPVVVAALSERGIDFDAPDGRCARVIFLVLTAPQDGGAQIEIMSGIARGLRHPGSVDLAVAARNLAGFVAVLREGLDLDERQRTASGIVRR
jgi:PTS system nitrogen regulatory IIA component